MKDRQPTQVLSNGAIRYGVYNADGTLNHYEYLKREDAPTVEGTPLNKANLLSDTTAAKIWPGSKKPDDPTVNDALGKLSEGTAKVGDIAITARTDLSDAWLPVRRAHCITGAVSKTVFCAQKLCRAASVGVEDIEYSACSYVVSEWGMGRPARQKVLDIARFGDVDAAGGYADRTLAGIGCAVCKRHLLRCFFRRLHRGKRSVHNA